MSDDTKPKEDAGMVVESDLIEQFSRRSTVRD